MAAVEEEDPNAKGLGFAGSASLASAGFVAPKENRGGAVFSDKGASFFAGVAPKEKMVSCFFASAPLDGGGAPKTNFGLSTASFSPAASVAAGAPKLKVGTPGFAAAMAGAGVFAFSISSATAATALSFCSLFLAKNDAGHFLAANGAAAAAGDCPASVSSSKGKGRDAAWVCIPGGAN